MNPLAARLAAVSEEELGLAEVKRVCALPVGRRLTPLEVEAVSRAEVTPSWFAGTDPDAAGKPFRLWSQQAGGLVAFDSENGAFLPLDVGAGKEFLSTLIVKKAHTPKPRGKGIKRSLLVVPSRVFRKLVERDIPKSRKIFGFDVPVYRLSGLSPRKRIQLAQSGLAGVYCTTYSLFQRDQIVEELKAISPQLVVVNEAHHVLTDSASSKRFWRMMSETMAMLVGLSGTMSKKSFMDCLRMLQGTLRERAPVPLQNGIASFWAQVLDSATGARLGKEFLEALEPLRQWALQKVREGAVDPKEVGGPLTPDAEGFRRAFRVRRNCAPGVVAASETDLGTSLIISNEPCYAQAGTADESEFEQKVSNIHSRLEALPRPLPEDFVPREAFAQYPPFEKMTALLWAIKERWRTPNGDELDYAIHTWQGQYELSAGFYNELVWQSPEELVSSWHISQNEAEEILAKAKAHRLAQGRYIREVRAFLQRDHVPHLDTPLLVWDTCLRGRRDLLPDDVYDRWVKARAADFEGRPTRISKTARVCDWKIRAATEWAREVESEHGKKTGGLIWAFNIEIAEWAFELFTAEFGPERVIYCPAGPTGDRKIQEEESARFFTIASIPAHFEGKDLPHYQHQVFLQWPRGANIAHQTIGRTHRSGQKADELVIRTLNTTDFDHANYCACLADAMWLSQSETKQKIVYATYETSPKLYPSRFLEEQGFSLLSQTQDAAMKMVFSV